MKRCISFLLLLCLATVATAQNQIDKQGRRQGKWLRTDKDGSKIFEGEFKDGLEVGTFTYYYSDGTVRLRNTFLVPGRYCAHEAYNRDGKLIARGFFNQKNRDSVWTFYNEEGRLLKLAGYRMGIKQGPHIVFDANGDTVEFTNWADNRRDGRWWKRIGKKGYITGHYKNGRMQGNVKEYDDEGRMVRDGNYVNGEKEGRYRYFDEKGVTVDEQWQNGALRERKVRLTTASGNEMIATYAIAYLYPRGRQTQVYRMDGSSTRCEESIETLFDRIGAEQFVLLDAKARVVANTVCIMGLTRDEEGREIVHLDPNPPFSVFPDEDCKKMITSLQRGEELDE